MLEEEEKKRKKERWAEPIKNPVRTESERSKNSRERRKEGLLVSSATPRRRRRRREPGCLHPLSSDTSRRGQGSRSKLRLPVVCCCCCFISKQVGDEKEKEEKEDKELRLWSLWEAVSWFLANIGSTAAQTMTKDAESNVVYCSSCCWWRCFWCWCWCWVPAVFDVVLVEVSCSIFILQFTLKRKRESRETSWR